MFYFFYILGIIFSILLILVGVVFTVLFYHSIKDKHYCMALGFLAFAVIFLIAGYGLLFGLSFGY